MMKVKKRDQDVFGAFAPLLEINTMLIFPSMMFLSLLKINRRGVRVIDLHYYTFNGSIVVRKKYGN